MYPNDNHWKETTLVEVREERNGWYEQAIQIAAAEILRHMLARGYESSRWEDDSAAAKRDCEEIDAACRANKRITALDLSGAQWGAALNLACQLYNRGPRAVMADERTKERHIQVSSTFPIPCPRGTDPEEADNT